MWRAVWQKLARWVLRFGGGWSVVDWAPARGAELAAVGDGRGSSLVLACLRWAARTLPEAPVVVQRRRRDGQWQLEPRHPLAALLARPNPHYSLLHLWSATVADLLLTGNAYWLKRRSPQGRVVELWWAPASTLEPRWPADGSAFVSHYDYTVDGQVQALPPSDVVHFRDGFDPANVRKGLSPLAALAREVFADQEAARWTAALLRNMAVPGVILAPRGEAELTPEEAARIKAEFMARVGGDLRGSPLVFAAPTDVTVLGWSPEQMQLREVRRLPEERVTAVFGIPAIVVGLGAGLDRSTFCLPGETPVWTVQGPKPIAAVQPGDVVWSFAEGQLVPRRVTHAACTGTVPLLEIRTKNRVIRATGNHPFLVRVPGRRRGGPNAARRVSYTWKRADELQVGDHVVQVKALPDLGTRTLPDGRPATPELLQFLGALLGDGGVSPTQGLIRLAMPPTDRCVATYRALATQLFRKYGGGGVRPWRRKQDGRTEVIVARVAAGASYAAVAQELGMHPATVRSRYRTATCPPPLRLAPITITQGVRDFGFRAAAAARALVALGVHGTARTKRVPPWVFGLARDLRLAYLAGVVDSDGYIDARGALTFTFANRALVEDVRMLLVSCGIQCSNIQRRMVPARALPNPGRQAAYEVWTCTASSAVQVAEIPFADPVYRQRVRANATRLRRDGFDAAKAGLSADLGFYEVKAIRPCAPAPVYDLTVAGSHSFVAAGFVVHNSNMAEAREAAYESFIIPLQRLLAAELTAQLVPDFDDPLVTQVAFDLSAVRVLQADETARAERVSRQLLSGRLTINEARVAEGLPPLPGGDVLLLPRGVTPTPPAALAPEAP